MIHSKNNITQTKAIWCLAIVTSIILIVVSVFCFCLNHNYDRHQHVMVVTSASALIQSISAVNEIAFAKTSIQCSGAEQRQHMDGSKLLILQRFCYAVLLLSLTFSEARAIWHIGRELYFGLGFLAAAVLVVVHAIQERMAARLPFVSVVAFLMCGCIGSRYISGAQGILALD